MSDERSSAVQSRRSFLTTTGIAAAGLTLADMLSARQAPAQIKGTNLRMLIWSHYVPAYDAAASCDAWTQTIAWFNKFLRAPAA